MEINLREFIRNYKEYLDQQVSVSRRGEIVGIWIPYEIARTIQDNATEDESGEG